MKRFFSMVVLSLIIFSFIIFSSSLIQDKNLGESVKWTSHQQIANDNIFEWHSFEELG